MTLAEAIKHIILRRSKILISDFFLEDFKDVLSDWGKEMLLLLKTGPDIKTKAQNFSYQEIKAALLESYDVLKALPRRVRDGFQEFYFEFLQELDAISDNKEKSLFALKVIGSLVVTTLGLLYNQRKGTAEITLNPLKRPGNFTRLMAADLLIRIIQAMVLRFLNGLEDLVDESDEKIHLKYLINLISLEETELSQDDSNKAILIVQHLRSFLMTGHKES